MRRFFGARLFLTAALVANAQTAAGLFGTVVDPGGFALPRAIVHLSTSNRERQYDGLTDTKGRFRFSEVLPGDYEISIQLQGFQARTFDVRVNSGTATDVGVQQLSFAPCNVPGGPICDDFYYASPKKTENSQTRGPGGCPDSARVKMLEHQIAYQRTEESDPMRGLSVIHADVWMRGRLTGFYIREPMYMAVPGIRDTYIFGEDGLRGGGTCPIEKNWRVCIEGFADSGSAEANVTTCRLTIDLRHIPRWRPSPDSEQKRRIARELRREIEDQWGEAEKIVIRDFNLADNQLTVYVKTKDGEQYHGCGFRAMQTPHCEGWHLFGQAPISSIREWIFARPYKLK